MPSFCPEGFASAVADYRFLTYRHQANPPIGRVSDRCRKVSSTFLVIRENDKTMGHYHYHAIMLMDKEPPKSWYTKGVHINLQKIGRRNNPVGMVLPLPGPTAQEDAELLAHEPERRPEIELRNLDIAMERHAKKAKRQLNVDKVLAYMTKEYTDRAPVRYVDYVYLHKGVSTVLPPRLL